MARISGVDLPREKRVEIGLTDLPEQLRTMLYEVKGGQDGRDLDP